MHILRDQNIHCSTAILEFVKDRESDAWHQYHLKQKDRKEHNRTSVQETEEAETNGTSCDMLVRLVCVAIKYNKTYTSLDPFATSKGMYDNQNYAVGFVPSTSSKFLRLIYNRRTTR